MTVQDFLSRLKGVRQTGTDKWVACCPAHDDDNPSLGVAVGSDGRILVHCYTGCTAEQVVQAMGLTLRDLMPETAASHYAPRIAPKSVAPVAEVEPKPKAKGGRSHGRLVATYDYKDEQGTILYRVERRVREDGKKTFIQLHPDPKSPFGWGFGVSSVGVRKVPYKLPRVLAAAKAGKTILIVEGEKDVQTVERVLGCVATCNSGGAGKWEAGWGKYFAGAKSILIIADNDAETKTVRGKTVCFAPGQKHACRVEALLRADGVACPIRKMVMPCVNGEKVKDFTDWAEAVVSSGGEADAESFALAVKSAAPWPERWNFGMDGEPPASFWQAAAEAGAAEAPALADGATGADGVRLESDRHGRFGRRLPRAPKDTADKIEVAFAIDQGHKVTLTIDAACTVGYNFSQCLGLAMRAFPNLQMPRDMFVRLKSFVAAEWLLARGSFFWDVQARSFASCYFLDRDEKRCSLMRIESDEFYAFVASAAALEDVDPKKGDLKRILGIVRQMAMSEEYAQGIAPSNQWDRRGDTIYISSGDDRMYRIAPGKIENVQNGTDGVVFLRGQTLAPWKLLDGDGVDPFDDARLFANAAWEDASGKMNIRLWYLNLFACHRTKPVMLITGKMQSGKTRMATGIKEILFMRVQGEQDKATQTVEDTDKSLEGFWTTLNGGKLEVFDNVDTKVKWFSDAIQNAATGGQIKRRTMYTNTGVTILRANANVILTSNSPLFSTDGNGGLADRLITVNLGTTRTLSEEEELTRQIAERRNAYLTWTARVLAKALADTTTDDGSINKRHPDYGKFSLKCGRALGCVDEVKAALGAAEADKALLPLRTDVVTAELLGVLADHDPPYEMRFTSGEMSDAIVARMGDEADDKTRSIYNSRRVGNAIKRYIRQLNLLFNMREPRISAGKSLYEFDGLTDLGKLVLSRSPNINHDVVGLVDSKPSLQPLMRECGGAGEDRETPLEPTKPTSADLGEGIMRARDIDNSFLRKEEKKGKEEWELDL